MPLPRRKESGASAAPVLNLLRARVKLVDVEEYETPRQVTRKSDGATFWLDPQFSCTVVVVDDGQDGRDNSAKFYESFRYKEDPETGEWTLRQYSKLGALAQVLRPNYFEDPTIPELTAEDLEGAEIVCRIKPKKNASGQVTGSMIEWDSMSPAPKREASENLDEEELEDWEQIPF
jgi:hypothetical protein